MRLIDADALMEGIKSNDYVLVDSCNTKDFGMYTIGIQQAVDEQPAIEPTAPQWTSVKDGLPEEKVSVLAAYIGCNDKKVYADGCARLDDGRKWTLDDGEVLVEITHWMPLPEPPQEETQ